MKEQPEKVSIREVANEIADAVGTNSQFTYVVLREFLSRIFGYAVQGKMIKIPCWEPSLLGSRSGGSFSRYLPSRSSTDTTSARRWITSKGSR